MSSEVRQNLTENTDGNTNYAYLFDTGVTEDGVIHNADLLGMDFSNIDGIILSHGHFDHATGLVNILKRISSKRSSPLIFSCILTLFYDDGWFCLMERKQGCRH